MIKYRTKFEKIEALEILRETEHFVYLPGSITGKAIREAKRSEWQNWHDTWEDAHQFLIDAACRKVDSLRMQLERANGRLGQIKGMRPDVKMSGTP